MTQRPPQRAHSAAPPSLPPLELSPLASFARALSVRPSSLLLASSFVVFASGLIASVVIEPVSRLLSSPASTVVAGTHRWSGVHVSPALQGGLHAETHIPRRHTKPERHDGSQGVLVLASLPVAPGPQASSNKESKGKRAAVRIARNLLVQGHTCQWLASMDFTM